MQVITESGYVFDLNDSERRAEFAAAQRSSSASAELDRKVRAYMSAHNEPDYRKALEMVRLDPANESLFYSYSTGREPGGSGDARPRTYTHSIEDASQIVLAKAKAYAAQHGLDVGTAAHLVLNFPENAELKAAYSRAA